MSVVEWQESARDELADLWVQAAPAERPGIEQAVLAAERDLADDPLAVGESRFDRVRVEVGREEGNIDTEVVPAVRDRHSGDGQDRRAARGRFGVVVLVLRVA